jgi:hypothetical protein
VGEFKANTEYARAFEASGSGGSGASPNGLATGQDNPWNPATFNLTKQGQIFQSNPAMAKTMAAMYGKTLQF